MKNITLGLDKYFLLLLVCLCYGRLEGFIKKILEYLLSIKRLRPRAKVMEWMPTTLNGIEVPKSSAVKPTKKRGASDIKITTIGVNLAKEVFRFTERICTAKLCYVSI